MILGDGGVEGGSPTLLEGEEVEVVPVMAWVLFITKTKLILVEIS
jgi:hypothetical protein